MVKVDQKIIFLVLGRVIQSVLAVVGIRLMTEIISPEQIGYQYLVTSIALWFTLVAINPLGLFIFRHLYDWKNKQYLRDLTKQLNRYFLIVAALSIPIVFILKFKWHLADSLGTFDIILFVAIYLYFNIWFQTIASFFNLLGQQKLFVSINILAQGSGLLFSVCGSYWIRPTALVWMGGLVAGQTLAFFVALYFFYKENPKPEAVSFSRSEGVFQKATFQFCYPIAIATLFMWFLNQGYRLVVEKSLGAGALAFFGVGLGLATSLAGVVESVVTQYFYPLYYAQLPDSDFESRKKAWLFLWRSTSFVYIPFCFLIVSAAYLVLKVLTASHFHSATQYLIYGAFIELLRQLSTISHLAFSGEKKTKIIILPYFMGAFSFCLLLAITHHQSVLTADLVLNYLLIGALVTFATNIIIVRWLFKSTLYLLEIGRSFLLSLPLLIPLYFLNVFDSLFTLIQASLACVIWFTIVVLFLFKKNKQFFNNLLADKK